MKFSLGSSDEKEILIIMKRTLLLVVLAASCASAQEKGNVFYQTSGSVIATAPGTAPGFVQGAPFSATITNETVVTLADGNRIVQSSTGTTARDSQGRTRQDVPLPSIGSLSAANAPHLAFIHDPVAQVSYTLNLTDKTAQKMPGVPSLSPEGGPGPGPSVSMRVVTAGAAPLSPSADAMSGPVTLPAGGVFIQKQVLADDHDEVTTEDLGSQTMEGVLVNGTRTTRIIPAGEIGNERPITVVTEAWTSPDLKTIVYSKRSDPRMGETTFRLSNLVRAEPDASFFTVPADFKITDGPKPVIYRTKP